MNVIKSASYHQWAFRGGNTLLENSSGLAAEFSCRILLDDENAALRQDVQIRRRAVGGAYENNPGNAIEVTVITMSILGRLDIEPVQSLGELTEIANRQVGPKVPASAPAHQGYVIQAREVFDRPVWSSQSIECHIDPKEAKPHLRHIGQPSHSEVGSQHR